MTDYAASAAYWSRQKGCATASTPPVTPTIPRDDDPFRNMKPSLSRPLRRRDSLPVASRSCMNNLFVFFSVSVSVYVGTELL